MHNKSISPSYAEDQAPAAGAGSSMRRRPPPPRLIYTTTVAQMKASCGLKFRLHATRHTSQVTWSACIMPYGRLVLCAHAHIPPNANTRASSVWRGATATHSPGPATGLQLCRWASYLPHVKLRVSCFHQRFCDLLNRSVLADPPPSPDVELNSASALPASCQCLQPL